jgi:hypothetical protein
MSPPPRFPRAWTAGTREDSIFVQQVRAGAFHRCPSDRFPPKRELAFQALPPRGCLSLPRFQPPLRRGATFHTTVPSRCASSVPFRPIPRRAPTFRATTAGGCPSPAALPADSPGGAGLLRSGLGANALRHCLWTDPSDAVAGIGDVSIALPLARPRESETSSLSRLQSSFLRTPPAPPL